MKRKLLFVTKGIENCDEGFSYALDLANSVNAGIEMLIVTSKSMSQSYEDIMAAVAFAEAGDHETARRLYEGEKRYVKEAVAGKVEKMARLCAEASIECSYGYETGDAESLIKKALKEKTGIHMVLLSPNLMGGRLMRNLKDFIKSISKPVVAINKTAGAEI